MKIQNQHLSSNFDMLFWGKSDDRQEKVPLLNLNLASSIDTDLDSLSDYTSYETKRTDKP